MKHLFAGCICALSLVAIAPAQSTPPTLAPSRSSAPVDPGWPRQLERNGYRLIYQQPQIQEWKDYRVLKARTAFVFGPIDGSAVPGFVDFEGTTSVNRAKRSVFIEKPRILSLQFPSLSENESASLAAELRKVFPQKGITIALDRVLAGADRQTVQTVELKMEPPAIFSSPTPAILLMVAGTPVLAPAGESGVLVVVNANWDLFWYPAGESYYLFADKVWLTAKALAGEWTLAPKVPDLMKELPSDWSRAKASLPFKASKGMVMPKVFFSGSPAELILFEGQPAWAKIPGTKLLWATNSESWVFKEEGTNRIYFLASGRWFSAPSPDGPWTYAGNDLPEDFQRIPDSHVCADVRASVPGTAEAADAALLAGIPVEAVVKRSAAEAKAAATYDGVPEFVPIDGTPISYARNTASDVLKVNDRYYLCQDAVWFESGSDEGPWKVCTKVPPEVASIPPANPLYPVTYAKTGEGGSASLANSSYTAGYLGSYIVPAGGAAVQVWGTGFHYPAYVQPGANPIYRPYAASYGNAAAYNPWSGGYMAGQRGYGPHALAGRAAWINPQTGRYGRSASDGSRTLIDGYNPHSDVPWGPGGSKKGYFKWGGAASQRGDDWVRAWNVQTEEGTVVPREEGVYAAQDGILYRRAKEGWSKLETAPWADPNRFAQTVGTSPAPDIQHQLNGEAEGRTRGTLQTSRHLTFERNGTRLAGSRSFVTGEQRRR